MRKMPKGFHVAVLSITLPFLLAVSCDGTPTTSPATPTGLEAQAGDGQVVLSWAPNAEANLLRYNVHRGTTSGELAKIDEVPAGTETYTDSDVDNGTTYVYALDAENDRGVTSNLSAELTATPSASGTAGVWDESSWDEANWGP